MNKKEQNKQLVALKEEFKDLLATLDNICDEGVATLGYDLNDEVAQDYVWDYFQDGCNLKNLRVWIEGEKLLRANKGEKADKK
jgi:hypothetical protein